MANDNVVRTGRAWAVLAATATVLWMGACGDDTSDGGGSGLDAGPQAALGASCESSSGCASGMCLMGAASHMSTMDNPICSMGCSADADCAEAGLVCGTGPSGASVCAPPCGVTDGFACVNGLSVACSRVQSGNCAECGCPAGERCGADGDLCSSLADLGTPCAADGDCLSDNCGQDGACKVGIGDTCDATNCDSCLVKDDWSFCSKACEVQADCDGAACLKPPEQEEFSCRPLCASQEDEAACPETCQIADSGGESDTGFYCRCESCEIAVVATEMDGGSGDELDGGQ